MEGECGRPFNQTETQAITGILKDRNKVKDGFHPQAGPAFE